MPPRNVAPQHAIKQFACEICNKEYTRQPDYENHLTSYDHTHRERLLQLKVITAAQGATESGRAKNRGFTDLRAVPMGGPTNKSTAGPRFTSVTNSNNSRFKRVDSDKMVNTSANTETKETQKQREAKIQAAPPSAPPAPIVPVVGAVTQEVAKKEVAKKKKAEKKKAAKKKKAAEKKQLNVEEEDDAGGGNPLMENIRAGGDPWEEFPSDIAEDLKFLAAKYGF